MTLGTNEVGLERGAVKLVLDREPRIMNRFNEGGPVRVTTEALQGNLITVEYIQISVRSDPKLPERVMKLRLTNMTESQTSILRELYDGTGPLTVKIKLGVSTTYTVTFQDLIEGDIKPLIGEYTESSPQNIRPHNADVTLSLE
jgi:hypothetical protein